MVLDAALAGDRVLVATQSGRVEAYDWRTGDRLPALLALAPEAGQELAPTVPCVAVSPGEQRVAAASSDGALWLFELDAGGAVLRKRTLSSGRAIACRFLDEGRLLLGSLQGDLALLDVETGREIFRRQLDYDPVYAVSVSPDGRRVAVAMRSSRIHVVGAESGEEIRILEGHRDSVFGLGWAGDQILVSGSKDKHVLSWDLSVEPPRPRILYHGDRYVTAVAIDPARARVAVALEDHRIGLLQLESGRVVRRLAGHSAPIQTLAFAGNGTHLVSAGNDARVLVWEIATTGGGDDS